MKYRLDFNFLLVAFLLFINGCATPTAPTGGPPDKEGPKITSTEPKTGTVNFKKKSITLHFSEFVDRGSLSRALVVEPEIGIKYSLDWGRKSVEIKFDRAIPDSTTLIVTIGTEFTDVNRNKMVAPYKVAVSTGPEIDKAKISGQIRNAQTGEKNDGQRVLLYRTSTKITDKADYIASTDTSGTFLFSYLGPGTYKAFWVDDRNRNKIWEPDQERAQPFKNKFVNLNKDDSVSIGRIYVTTIDTTRPKLQGIGLFSSKRLRLRFSENIKLSDSLDISITDTTGNAWSKAYPLYIKPDQRFVLFAQSRKALNDTSSYKLHLSGITDEYGNAVIDSADAFTGSAQKDTTKQRIIERNTTSGYFPNDPIIVTYAKPFEGSAIKDSLVITAGDTLMNRDSVQVTTPENKLVIAPAGEWKAGVSHEIRFWDPIISDFRKIQPDIWYAADLGKLDAMIEDSIAGNIKLSVSNEEASIKRDTAFTDSVLIERLPPLQYRVIAYSDSNKNGQWDFGKVDPFLSPEPYFIQNNVPVKKDFTADLHITFKEEKQAAKQGQNSLSLPTDSLNQTTDSLGTPDSLNSNSDTLKVKSDSLQN